MRVVAEVRRDHPDVQLQVIDISDRPDLAVKYRVMMTPAIAINGELAFAGAPAEPALRARILAARSPE